MNEYSDFFCTSSGIKIFHTTNFQKSDFDPQKPLLIFNYGLLCSNHHWEKQLPFFHEKGFQILTHDYRFHFNSSAAECIKECSFKNIVEDLAELIKSIGSLNNTIFGHSMGVNVSLELARSYPKLVKGMILISGTVLPPHDIMFDTNLVEVFSPYLKMFTHKYPDLFKKLWSTAYLNPIARKVVYRGGFNTKKVPEEFVKIYMQKIGELPPELFLQLLDQMKAHDILNDLEVIDSPTLVIGGDNDQVIPNYLQKILHQHLPNSELYIVGNGSHVPQADFPETLNERVYKFLVDHKSNC